MLPSYLVEMKVVTVGYESSRRVTCARRLGAASSLAVLALSACAAVPTAQVAARLTPTKQSTATSVTPTTSTTPITKTTTQGDHPAFSPAVSPAVKAPITAVNARVENAKTGTDNWKLAPMRRGTMIEGYADHASALKGEHVGLYVRSSGRTFQAVVYRMGWYSGHLGHYVWSSPVIRRARQPRYLVDPTTRMATTRWKRSLVLQTST